MVRAIYSVSTYNIHTYPTGIRTLSNHRRDWQKAVLTKCQIQAPRSVVIHAIPAVVLVKWHGWTHHLDWALLYAGYFSQPRCCSAVVP